MCIQCGEYCRSRQRVEGEGGMGEGMGWSAGAKSSMLTKNITLRGKTERGEGTIEGEGPSCHRALACSSKGADSRARPPRRLLLLSRVMTRLRVTWCLVLLLQLGLQPCELRRASAKEAAAGKSKTARSKSADTARLQSEHPVDPVKWFDQVNVHFKAGEKAKAADLLHDASHHFPNQPDMAFNHAYGGHVASLFFLVC